MLNLCAQDCYKKKKKKVKPNTLKLIVYSLKKKTKNHRSAMPNLENNKKKTPFLPLKTNKNE